MSNSICHTCVYIALRFFLSISLCCLYFRATCLISIFMIQMVVLTKYQNMLVVLSTWQKISKTCTESQKCPSVDKRTILLVILHVSILIVHTKTVFMVHLSWQWWLLPSFRPLKPWQNMKVLYHSISETRPNTGGRENKSCGCCTD